MYKIKNSIFVHNPYSISFLKEIMVELKIPGIIYMSCMLVALFSYWFQSFTPKCLSILTWTSVMDRFFPYIVQWSRMTQTYDSTQTWVWQISFKGKSWIYYNQNILILYLYIVREWDVSPHKLHLGIGSVGPSCPCLAKKECNKNKNIASKE